MSAALLEAPIAEKHHSAARNRLEISAAEFQVNFNCRPFLIGHHLADHPLFELPRLVELLKSLPEHSIEYNAGDIPMSLDPKLTPRNGLSPEETIRRIEECRSWMVLKDVQQDPGYRELLDECLSEVRPHSEPLVPGMRHAQAFIFVTSPNSVTPYHIDPEHNFLLQIRGAKTVHLFDGRDRNLLREDELEYFYAVKPRNLIFREENRDKAWVFDLQPGYGLHFPVTYPHWVQNQDNVSISFSITFRTPDLEKRRSVYAMNYRLRQRGGKPSPFGKSPWVDTAKYQFQRVWTKLARRD